MHFDLYVTPVDDRFDLILYSTTTIHISTIILIRVISEIQNELITSVIDSVELLRFCSFMFLAFNVYLVSILYFGGGLLLIDTASC